MVSFATLMKPHATSSTLRLFPVSALMSLESCSSAKREASTSSASFSLSPKIFGKCSGRRRPRTKFASVIAGGPFFLAKEEWSTLVGEFNIGMTDR